MFHKFLLILYINIQGIILQFPHWVFCFVTKHSAPLIRILLIHRGFCDLKILSSPWGFCASLNSVPYAEILSSSLAISDIPSLGILGAEKVQRVSGVRKCRPLLRHQLPRLEHGHGHGRDGARLKSLQNSGAFLGNFDKNRKSSVLFLNNSGAFWRFLGAFDDKYVEIFCFIFGSFSTFW